MVTIVLGTALAAIGAGIAVGMACLGSGIGQGIAAAGSVGAVAEDPDMFARGLIFTALPETQAIYGFLIAILLLVFLGIMTGASTMSVTSGFIAIGAGAAVGFAGLGSGMGQGITASSAVGAVEARHVARGIIFTAISETHGYTTVSLLLYYSWYSAGIL